MSESIQNIEKGRFFEFVKKELVRANTQRVECADGRYTPEQSQGAIRAFGGDFGIVLAFAAALKAEGTFLDPSEIIERYFRAVKQFRGDNAKIYYHTDEHSYKEGKIGCAHAAQASNPHNEGEYGISSKEAEELYQEFAKHHHSNLTILQGEHKEKAVLVVEGVSYSLNSKSKNLEFFVVTPEMIDKHIDLITPIFSRGLISFVDPEDVKARYIMQQAATSKHLGVDKLPIFKVGLNSKGHFIMEQWPRKLKDKS